MHQPELRLGSNLYHYLVHCIGARLSLYMQTLHQTYNPKNCKVISNNLLASPMTNKAFNVTPNPYTNLTTEMNT